MSLKKFIFSKIFLKNLGLAVVIAVGSVMLLLIWLNFYTRHGQSRPVPDFYALNIEQARSLARKSKLRFQIIDSIYTSQVPRGCVAEQNPKPGFRVKKWRNVTVTINAFRPEMVAMPNLVDLSLRQASKVLESSGLQMGQRRYKPDISIDFVLEQRYNGRQIEPGDSIQKGSSIDLILGKGLSNQRTSIPDLVGLALNPAKTRIMESSLVLGTFVYDKTINSSSDSIRAFVYKQNPEYRVGATIPLGSDIYLWLTTDTARLASEPAAEVNDTTSSGDVSSLN
ncbi:MAG TPA: PASTA domain-containing protein [Bacteroidales bacterium]|nr:PASTA domain-containing protein [Bacteroidales bacterium]